MWNSVLMYQAKKPKITSLIHSVTVVKFEKYISSVVVWSQDNYGY